MEAGCAGARQAGGVTVGVLPGERADEANLHVSVAIATGAGQGRNVMLVNSADAVIAIGKGYGTLSELALALRAGKPVVSLGSWDGVDEAVRQASGPQDAVLTALDATRSA